MVCSHCKGTGHTYKKCPTITPEEKLSKQNELKKKKSWRFKEENRDYKG